ncbi:MAG TPA: hypothetical protein VGX28_13490 [Frankiaceae bacterium]|jgi:hypothetical protein|nr:hypothetical protein [Frankiaceae bacterium]
MRTWIRSLRRNATLRGAASAFDLRGNTTRHYPWLNRPGGDLAAVSADFEAVCADFRAALDKVAGRA